MSDDCNDQSPPATAWIMPAEFLARAAVVDVWPWAGGWCSHDPRAIDDRTSGNAHHAARGPALMKRLGLSLSQFS